MTDDVPEEVLRVYALAVEMADRISARRGASNQFYLAIETLLLGLPAGFAAFGRSVTQPWLLSGVLAVGAVIAVLWWLQLRAYRDLNREKFRVIQDIERRHLRVRPYVDEWEPLVAPVVRKRWRERYRELGALERLVPLVFAVFDVLVGVIVWV